MGRSWLLIAPITVTVATLWLIKDGEVALGVDKRARGSTLSQPEVVNGPLASTESDFLWNTITPTPKLVWKQCYTLTLECARLQVPLDYSNPRGRQASIALIRRPSIFPRSSPLYKGPVLFNPGGPGGSGVDLVHKLGMAFATILGPGFDIVGFDPRGIARSTPKANFFSTDVERALFGQNSILILPNDNNSLAQQIALPRAQATLLGTLATEKDDGYLQHLNTANTATDMLSIVQAFGREKLQYWGFSYGSVLGATFASMYPDKVDRLAIDGVVDSEDYYATDWLTNLVDTEKTLSAFFDNCADAGPLRCRFHAPTPDDIRRNLTALYENLRKQPIPVRTRTQYGVVTERFLRQVVFASLYTPHGAWPALAIALERLSAGDGSALLSMIREPPFSCSCDPREHEYDSVFDAQVALICNDGDKISSSFDELEKYFEKLFKVSEWADIWGAIHLGCVGWPTTKKYFRGPFVANTSHPILLVGNTADPVTPLRSAKKMSEGFKDSVVLTQDSPGHCSINNPSLCTMKYVQGYFQHGFLPKPDTVCQPIIKNPFTGKITPDGGQVAQAPLQVLEEDLELWNAMVEISEKFRPSFPMISMAQTGT